MDALTAPYDTEKVSSPHRVHKADPRVDQVPAEHSLQVSRELDADTLDAVPSTHSEQVLAFPSANVPTPQFFTMISYTTPEFTLSAGGSELFFRFSFSASPERELAPSIRVLIIIWVIPLGTRMVTTNPITTNRSTTSRLAMVIII